MKKTKVLVVLGLLVASLVLVGTNVLAKSEHSNSTRPGWGHGDKNHTHTGPPGGTSVRPGHGHGDDDHEHTGPPGRSVNPGEHGEHHGHDNDHDDDSHQGGEDD